MANYYEKARTNYFRVKNPDSFNEFVSRFNSIEVVPHSPDDGSIAILFDEEAGVPSSYYDNDGNDVEIDFIEELATYLTDDSILVVVGVGSEKYCYLSGFATAMNNKGESVNINLGEIYDLAEKKFGIKPTLAEY